MLLDTCEGLEVEVVTEVVDLPAPAEILLLVAAALPGVTVLQMRLVPEDELEALETVLV